MANHALILYASSTGNTAKVAETFRQVLEGYGWRVAMLQLEENTDLRRQGIFVDDYDLLLLGSPVISSGPSPLMAKKLALVSVDPPRVYRNELIFPGSFFRPERSPLGVSFVTYSGETYGPCEAEPALETMEMYLKYLFIPTIGRFACPARKESKSNLDLITSELGLSPAETAELMGRFAREPDADVFQSLSEDALELLRQTEQQSGAPVPVPEEFGEQVWHRNQEARPSQRDLTKARIFLAEILEDYFFDDGTARPPESVYTCIG